MIEIKVSNIGAELISVRFNNKEMLHEGKKNWDRQAPILFPMVGRLKDNKTKIDNEEYIIPQHGFAKDMEFELIEESENSKVFFTKSNEDTLKMYPFEFELYIAYLIKDDTLKTKCKVINTGKKDMLFGIGGHPGFKLDLDQDEYYFELNRKESQPEFMEVQGNYISNNPANNILKDNKIIEINEDSFINDAIMMKKLKSNKITLKQKDDDKKILEFNFEKFPILAIWSIPKATFICLEPWFNYADRVDSTGHFKDKEGIITLKPNNEFDCEFSVKFFR